MNAEKKLYTTKEAMEILGLKSNSGFFRKVKRHNIVPVKQWRYCFFTDEMVQDLEIDKQPGRPKTKTEKKRPRKERPPQERKKCSRYCWRVSVWNDELMSYVVVKCGLSRKEADEFAAGKNAVKRPCWR